MEYSVYDLIRILLKKWYIILITVAVFAGLSSVTAKKSYEAALREYDTYTSELEAVENTAGTLTAVCQYEYHLTDLSKYIEDAERKATFYKAFQSALSAEDAVPFDTSAYIEQAYQEMQGTAVALLTDTKVMSAVQNDLAGFQPDETDLEISDVLTVECLSANRFRLTVNGLDEDTSVKIAESYLKNLPEVGESDYSLSVEIPECTEDFALTPASLTQRAEFAQEIMERPTAAPILAKTVGTSAVMAFALACFGILLVTFIRDTKQSSLKEKQREDSSSPSAE